MAKRRKSLINTIMALNEQRRLTLFVGAGVSIGCGLPDWDELTKKVIAKVWKTDPITIELMNGYGNIQATRYARKKAGDQFNRVVRDSLYEKEGYEVSSLVHAIAKSGIDNICTFNFDDLLEDAILQNAIEPNVAVLGEPFWPSYQKPNIIHPHGLLERTASQNDLSKQRIIFSETEYNELYSDPYSWANLAQLSLLITHSALFIGLSLSDPNLRRLIDVTRRRGFNNQHFAIIKDPTKGRTKREQNYFRKVRTMREIDLKELGITPWFVNDYEYIEEIISCISIF